MTSTQGWIKMSERKPDKFPVWYYNNEDGQVRLYIFETSLDCFTHWQPATLPEPPKKEMTQRERDELSFTKWCPVMDKPLKEGRNLAWHAALAYRDKQNAEDLNLMSIGHVCGGDVAPQLHSLLRRCGLDQ